MTTTTSIVTEYTMTNLIDKIECWFYDRNLQNCDPRKQHLKLVEEFEELIEGCESDNLDEIKDAIGDMTVVLVGVTVQIEGMNFKNIVIDNYKPELYYGRHSGYDKVPNSILTKLEGTVDELKYYIEEQSIPDIEHSIVEILDNLKVLSENYNTDLGECLNLAYHEIKDRKGKLIDGIFVKEA